MATKNEKLIALAICDLSNELKEQLGIEFSEKITAHLKNMQEILEEEESQPTKGKSGDERFFYTGVEAVTMTQEQRNALGICEFTVTYKGEVILRVYWDATLNWIMQPDESGTTFSPVKQRKFPGQAYARSFLKKLAEEELEEKGTFAKKNYVKRPTAFVRTPAPLTADSFK